MYLVDTSVWIDYFRDRNNAPVRYLVDILENKIPFSITGMIYQEVLQGTASLRDFETLADYFSTQQFVYPKDNFLTHHETAKLYFDCRKKGITIRSSVDCLSAQIAIEQKLTILHNDKDFNNIKKIRPKLLLVTHDD